MVLRACRQTDSWCSVNVAVRKTTRSIFYCQQTASTEVDCEKKTRWSRTDGPSQAVRIVKYEKRCQIGQRVHIERTTRRPVVRRRGISLQLPFGAACSSFPKPKYYRTEVYHLEVSTEVIEVSFVVSIHGVEGQSPGL